MATTNEPSFLELIRMLIRKVVTNSLLQKSAIGAILLAVALRLTRKRKNVKGKLVVITGGAGGLGKAIAEAFAKRGARLALWDINEEGLKKTADEISSTCGVEVKAYKVNLVNREEVYALAKRVKQEQGEAWGLVNNAGILSGTALMDTPDKRIELLYGVNIMSHFWTTKAFLPDMLKNKSGHIVGVSSAAGLLPNPRMVDYCSSKFAARGFMDTLHTELHFMGNTGVSTTVVCPSHVNTELFKGYNVGSVMSPQWVAEQVLGAVETDQHFLILPRLLQVAIFWQTVLPTSIWDLCVSLSYRSMNTWKPDQANKVFAKMEA